jgi:sulfate permease, SulP family
VHWPAIAAQAGSIATVPLIAAIVLLLDASGIELAVSQDFDLNQELTAIGTANLASAVFGGVPGHYTISMSVLMHRMGVRSRLGGVVAAAVMLLPLLLSAALLSYLPKFVLGGLLLFFGWSFLSEWMIAARWLPRLDYAIVLLILAVVAMRGFLAGVGVGLVAAVALFVVEYSRVGVVRRVLTSATRRSRFTRARAQRQLLDAQGERISILDLQGYLFFGTAARLLDQIRAQITGLDSSALYAFSKLGRLASNHQFTIVLTGMGAELERQIAPAVAEARRAGWLRVEPDLDRGIE